MVGRGLKITGKTYADLIKKTGKQFELKDVDPLTRARKRRKRKKK